MDLKSFSGVVEKLVDFAFRSIWPVVGVFVIASILIHAEQSFLEANHIKDFRDQYISVIGLARLISVVWIGLYIADKVIKYVSKNIKNWKKTFVVNRKYKADIKKKKAWLDNLSDYQLQTLFSYVFRNKTTLSFDPTDHNIAQLSDMGFIEPDPSWIITSRMGASVSYTIDPWTRKYLSDKLEASMEERTKSLTQPKKE